MLSMFSGLLLAVSAAFSGEPVLGPNLGEITRAVEGRMSVRSTGCPTGSENIAAYNLANELALLYLINLDRQAHGIPPLKKSDALMRASRYHAWDMAVTNYFNHYSLNGSGTIVCSPGNRINAFYVWNSYAENIAAGDPNPNVINTLFINSPGHHDNMLSTTVYEAGTGEYYSGSSTYGWYWVEDYGRRTGVYPIVINLEAVSTSSTSVNLYIYGTDTFTQMRLKNDSDAWGSWQSFQATVTGWVIPNVAGTRTVYVELGTGGDPLASSSDDIEYTGGDAIQPTVTTTAVSQITTTTAFSGGNVTSDGGASVTARGVCWNTSGNPTVANPKTQNGSGTGGFTSTIAGLSANTTYYVRAYATNSVGTGYGSAVSFKTCPNCSGTAVTISNVTFPSGCNCNCTGTVSITAGSTVTVKAGATVTFTAPVVNLEPGFTVEPGANFSSHP
ncbi:MAG: CAP domain-containing protein [Pseudomonadota bacterium]